MTKTMVNNYVKSKVINPPVKKKYSKEQVMLLALVYQLKNILAISDVKGFLIYTIMKPYLKKTATNSLKNISIFIIRWSLNI